jgi:hypothetical protein
MIDVSFVLLLLLIANDADRSIVDRGRLALEKGIKSSVSQSLTDGVFVQHKTQTGSLQ